MDRKAFSPLPGVARGENFKFQSVTPYEVVVGSGPAGAGAACRLAQAGTRVAVLEKASLPRYKTCGGGIVSRALLWFPEDPEPVVEDFCPSASLHLFSDGTVFTARREPPLVRMTMRAQLDEFLIRAACAWGAHLYENCALLAVRRRGERVELDTSRGKFQARFVIAADGVLSQAARAAGFPPVEHNMAALEAEVQVGRGDLEKFRHTARFDMDPARLPHGYGWVFPKKGQLSIGVLSCRPRHTNLNRCLEYYLQGLGLREVKGMSRHGFLIPVKPRPGGFFRNRVLLAGDAAGLAEPVTGEGISHALQSGQLAARALLEGGFQESRVADLYPALLEGGILKELRWGRRLARLTYHWPRVSRALMSRYGQTFCQVLADIFAGVTSYREIFESAGTGLRQIRPAGRQREEREGP